MTSNILTIGDKIYNVVAVFSSFVEDIFFTTLKGLIQRYISQVESMPKLQEVLTDILDILTANFPTLATATFFEFCCGSALILTLVISLVRWLVGIFK